MKSNQQLFNLVSHIKKLLSKLGLFDVYYINGPDILPLPLPLEKETAMIAEMQSGNSEARNTLVEHNLRLVVYIARKFDSTGIGIEDLISIGTIGLIKAINSFKPDKNIKLATYASRCIENEILMYLRKFGNIRSEVSIDEPLNVDWDGNELLLSDILGSENDLVGKRIEADDDKNILKEALYKLSPRERQIMEYRFGIIGGEELTQKDVADLLGISQSYISRLEKKIIERLKKDIEKSTMV